MKSVIQKFLDEELSIATFGASAEDLYRFQDIVGLTWNDRFHSLGNSTWLTIEHDYLFGQGSAIRYGCRSKINNVRETMTVVEFLELCSESPVKIEEHDIMELFS